MLCNRRYDEGGSGQQFGHHRPLWNKGTLPAILEFPSSLSCPGQAAEARNPIRSSPYEVRNYFEHRPAGKVVHLEGKTPCDHSIWRPVLDIQLAQHVLPSAESSSKCLHQHFSPLASIVSWLDAGISAIMGPGTAPTGNTSLSEGKWTVCCAAMFSIIRIIDICRRSWRL